MACAIKVDPGTLYVTHIFDGEEVVRGGEDGQTWLATFSCPGDAEFFVDCIRKRASGELVTLQVQAEWPATDD